MVILVKNHNLVYDFQFEIHQNGSNRYFYKGHFILLKNEKETFKVAFATPQICGILV